MKLQTLSSKNETPKNLIIDKMESSDTKIFQTGVMVYFPHWHVSVIKKTLLSKYCSSTQLTSWIFIQDIH